MPARVWTLIVCLATVAACAGASAGSSVRKPLGAYLTPNATTGSPLPLRFDTGAGARVIPRSMAANLPPITYSPVQASRGETVYGQSCSRCHASSQFIGQQFVESWNGRRVNDLYTLVRSTMPLSDPGGLKDDEYLAIVAYLLKANHAAAGLDSLKPDTTMLRGHKIAVRLP